MLSPEWLKTVIEIGVVGTVLLWFMFRAEPRLRANEAAINRNTRALLVLRWRKSQSDRAADEAEAEAQSIIQEIDDAERAARKDPPP